MTVICSDCWAEYIDNQSQFVTLLSQKWKMGREKMYYFKAQYSDRGMGFLMAACILGLQLVELLDLLCKYKSSLLTFCTCNNSSMLMICLQQPASSNSILNNMGGFNFSFFETIQWGVVTCRKMKCPFSIYYDWYFLSCLWLISFGS